MGIVSHDEDTLDDFFTGVADRIQRRPASGSESATPKIVAVVMG
jgi:hypothetical protein